MRSHLHVELLVVCSLAAVVTGCGVELSSSNACSPSSLLAGEEPKQADRIPIRELLVEELAVEQLSANRRIPRIEGQWLVEEGQLAPKIDANTRLIALKLDEGGTGRVFLRDVATDAVDCVRVFHLFDGETLIVDLIREPSTFFLPDNAIIFPVVVVEPNMLGLAPIPGESPFFLDRKISPMT
ncbi:MAG: hypothetical protein ACYTHJ_03290 [Planctomycetota bacterium]